MKELLIWLCLIAFGYLLGSVMFSRIIPLLVCKKDVCKTAPDKNPGAANAFAACGVPLGMVCLLLDMAKGFFPVFATWFFFGMDYTSLGFAFVMIAPVLGHATAPFSHFHGGKCISTSFGVLIACLPFCYAGWVLAVTYILFSTVVKISPNRRRSLISYAVFAAISVPLAAWRGLYACAFGCLMIAAVAIAKHTKYFEQKAQETAEVTES